MVPVPSTIHPLASKLECSEVRNTIIEAFGVDPEYNKIATLMFEHGLSCVSMCQHWIHRFLCIRLP